MIYYYCPEKKFGRRQDILIMTSKKLLTFID